MNISYLYYINLPNSITSIGNSAFNGCSSLIYITIPSSVSSIDTSAFSSTYNMRYIEFESTTPPYIGNNALGNDYPIYVPSSAVSDYQTAWSQYSSRIMTKPEPISNNNIYAFAASETSLTFTNSNNDTYDWNLSVGFNWYYGDEPGFALNEITSVSAVSDNSALVDLDLSKLTSWTTVGIEAFYSCYALHNVILPDSITSIGQGAFTNSERLESITIPTSLTNLGAAAFAASGVFSLTFPATITYFGESSVNSCSRMTSLTCLATTPPTLGNYDVFTGTNCPIYVPAASVSAYQSAWSQVSSRIQPIP
jgi:hypothetical protein